MKNLFRKYMHSVLRPDEFSTVTDFLADKKNDPIIFGLMEPYWESEMQENDEFPEPNPELRNKIIHSILTDESNGIQRKLKMYGVGLRVAAVLIPGLIISSIFFYQKSFHEPYTGELQKITTPYGAKTNLTLPDGSLVWLNSGTTLTFYSAFGKERRVNLKGEAFFEVKKSSVPFIVSTDFGDVEVKGTAFDVNAYAGQNFQTTLIKGIVKVSEKFTRKEVLLKPGQQAEIFGSGLKVRNVETDLFSSWKDGKLIFRNEFLPYVAKNLERWYNVKIELAHDKRLSEIFYTGTLEMESFSEVLQLLKVTAPIDYSYDEKSRTIKIFYLERK